MVFDLENRQGEKGRSNTRKYAHNGRFSLKMDSMIQI